MIQDILVKQGDKSLFDHVNRPQAEAAGHSQRGREQP
jgi:hypothetical protein